MSTTYISKKLRERVAKQARHRCGYCLTQERLIGALLQIDHLIPEALGGLTKKDNLWLACAQCNLHKSNLLAGDDPLTGETTRLFNPRQQIWHEHFAWSPEGDLIIGTTATGRATVAALDLNRAPLVVSRRLWVSAGWHPPQE